MGNVSPFAKKGLEGEWNRGVGRPWSRDGFPVFAGPVDYLGRNSNRLAQPLRRVVRGAPVVFVAVQVKVSCGSVASEACRQVLGEADSAG